MGSSYRNLFAFIILLVVLILFPNGLFGGRRGLPPEPMTGTFIAISRPLHLPSSLVWSLGLVALVLPLIVKNAYILQTLTNAWLYGLLALSLTLVAGTSGLMSLGHAGLLGIGGYASALLVMKLGWPIELALPAAGVFTAALGTLLILPAFDCGVIMLRSPL